jgi:hypothetical protein
VKKQKEEHDNELRKTQKMGENNKWTLTTDSPFFVCCCLRPYSIVLFALPCSYLTLHRPICSTLPCPKPSTTNSTTIIPTLSNPTPLNTTFSIDVSPFSNPIPKAYLLLLLNNSCGAWSTLLPLANFIIVRKLEHHMSSTTTCYH